MFALLVAAAAAYDVKIIHPTALVESISNYNHDNGVWEDGLLRASLGNFGEINYGTTIRGRVHYPITNQDGCTPFEPTHFNGEHLRRSAEEGSSPIIMVDRGVCKFVEKARHIQDFGGIMALIVDNNEWESVEMEVMVSDGTDTGIIIPSFLINFHEGKMIKELVHSDDAPNELDMEDTEIFNVTANGTHPVIIQASLNLAGKTDNNLTVDIWYSSVYEFASQPAMMDLSDFALMSDLFYGKVMFHPRTEVRSCLYCTEESK